MHSRSRIYLAWPGPGPEPKQKVKIIRKTANLGLNLLYVNNGNLNNLCAYCGFTFHSNLGCHCAAICTWIKPTRVRVYSPRWIAYIYIHMHKYVLNFMYDKWEFILWDSLKWDSQSYDLHYLLAFQIKRRCCLKVTRISLWKFPKLEVYFSKALEYIHMCIFFIINKSKLESS